MMTEFTAVAAANPYAWFPTERSAEELVTPTPENRMIGFPYTKYLNAVLNTDQAGAYVMTSVAKARELGIHRGSLGVLVGRPQRGRRGLVRQHSSQLRRVPVDEGLIGWCARPGRRGCARHRAVRLLLLLSHSGAHGLRHAGHRRA